MTIVSTDLPEQMNEDLRLLVAVGLYKSKSEAMRDAIRRLTDSYRDNVLSASEVRARLDKAMGDRSLSSVIDEMREADAH